IVDERPDVARSRPQVDPVARLDPGRYQALGQRADVVAELAGGYVGPLVRCLAPAQHDGVGRAARTVGDDVGESCRGWDLGHGGNAELAQRASCHLHASIPIFVDAIASIKLTGLGWPGWGPDDLLIV